MKFLRILLFCSLFLSINASAIEFGNMGNQEIGDMVSRAMNEPLDLFASHTAIYVGQTAKEGNPSAEPLFHEVIEMAGIQPQGTKWSIWLVDGGIKVGKRVTDVKGIEFSDFRKFQKGHPKYHGAFMLNPAPDLAARKLILETAQRLKDQRPAIDYIVVRDESAIDLLFNYFRTEYDLSYYVESIGIKDIVRMRSDAFVEYCYAKAGVPIAKGLIGNSLNLATKNGAIALVFMASQQKLYPDNQRDWMAPSQIEIPTLIIKDPAGEVVSDIASATTLKFNMQDASSGPGLLKIHKDPIDSVYGMADFSFPIELLDNNTILTGNINSNKTLTLSKTEGLSPGYYQAAAYDHAGNKSNTVSFTVSDAPIFTGPSSIPLYQNFKGVSTLNPSTIEREHSFSFSDNIAGVSRVILAGPQGNVVDWTFDPPVPSTATQLAEMSPGQYQATIINSVGGETIAPFLGNFHFSLVGNGFNHISQSLTAKPVNSRTTRLHDAALLAKRNTGTQPRSRS